MVKKIRSIYEFESHVAGIPCIIAITGYYRGSPAVYSGPMAGPEESPEAEWRVLDRRGYLAPWLEKKLSSSDEERINEEAVEIMEG